MSSTEARTAAGSPIPSTGLPVTVAVTMAPGRPADQTVAATLCVPPGPPPATVQVLIPGGTYSQAH